MSRTPADSHFERFCRHGDMDALGDVFDETAPALYRIALHLRPSSWTAEDLVQTTFVTAIEKAQRFEAGRPVFPWLLGILKNHAREFHRVERYEPLRSEGAQLATPLDRLEGQEVRECIEAAIEGLAEPYRSVVRRFLEGGREPREISHELCRSPNTVRSQLKRGLAFVKRGLPGGLAPSVTILDLPERGLDAIRCRVLAHAQISAVSSTTTLVPLALVATLLTLLALAGVLAFTSAGTWGPGEAQVGTIAAAPNPDGHDPTSPAATATLPRTELATAESPDRNLLPAQVRGRVVDATTGRPLPTIAVELVSLRQIVAATRVRGAEGKKPLAGAASGADGWFQFGFTPRPEHMGYQLRVGVGTPDRAEVRLALRSASPGEEVDFDQIPLPHGGVVTGRVLDREGRPLRTGTLRIASDPPLLAKIHEGNFRTPRPVPVGQWSISIHGGGVSHPEPASLDIRSLMTNHVEVRVTRRPAIRGLVIDEAGDPIQGVLVRCDPPTGASVCQTDAAGRFELFAEVDTTPSAAVDLVASAWTILPGSGREQVQWGTTAQPIHVRRSSSLPIQVLDREGRPVSRFAVRCNPGSEVDGIVREGRAEAVHLDRMGLRHGGDHPEGRLEVTRVWPGWNLIRIFPDDREWAASEPRPVWIEPGRRELLVLRLDGKAGVQIQVRDSDGGALAGVRVELELPPSSRRAELIGRSVATAVTGRGGTADLTYASSDLPLRLRVRANGFSPAVVDMPMHRDRLPVTLTRAGSLVGRLGLPTTVRRVLLRSKEGSTRGTEAPVRRGGGFQLRDVPPGVYSLVGLHEVRRQVPGRYDRRFLPIDPPLASVTIREGRETRLEITPSLTRGGTIRGQIRLAGSPPPASWLYLERQTTGAAEEQGPYRVAATGEFLVEDLVPGRYRIRWSRHGALAAALQQSVWAKRTVDVVRDGQHLFAVDLPGTGLALRVVRGDPPVALVGQAMTLTWKCGEVRLATDAQGRAVLPFAPAGSAAVSLPGGKWVAGPVVVPAGGPSARITLPVTHR